MAQSRPSRKAGSSPGEGQTRNPLGPGEPSPPFEPQVDEVPPKGDDGGVAADRGLGYILDASALLAMLRREPGADLVTAVIDTSLLSAVNWCEVVQKALAYGIEVDGLQSDLGALGLVIVPFTPEDGEIAGQLWQVTRSAGLSLGDRACLALASRFGVPALTADRAWAELGIEGIEVELLR